MARIVIPFKPRDYQKEVADNFPSKYKRCFLLWHRRAGKDMISWNLLVREAIKTRGIYYYVFPSYTQGKKILWDNKDMMKCIPEQLIGNKNHSEMKIELVSGSVVQIVGSDRYDSLRGTDPKGVVMSEYAYQHPLAWETIRPILAANGGWAIFNTTPNGKNHAYDLWNYAEDSDKWYTNKKIAGDTKVIDKETLAEEQASMDKSMFLQEYFCSFDIGAFGAYYRDEMTYLFANDRVRKVDYDPSLLVDTFWDIGMSDQTAIWFFQKLGQEIRVIDYLEDNNKGFADYLSELERRDYNYGKHYLPHDFKHKEFILGESRLDYARKRGFENCEIVPRPSSKMEAIDTTRRILKKCFFDKEKCKQGIRCLENYHREYDEVKKVFQNKPCHDWSSHGADAFSYMALTYKINVELEPRKENPATSVDWDEGFESDDTPFWIK